MNEWMPIKTAPKDGRFLWLIEDGADLGLLLDHQFCGYWASDKRYLTGGSWKYINYDGLANPTHWMPLPPPPKETKWPN